MAYKEWLRSFKGYPAYVSNLERLHNAAPVEESLPNTTSPSSNPLQGTVTTPVPLN
ncbi:MAG: hypothetical protein H6765_11430 [Candidatus Peribacteria bacterium]|nr:MAG: hypothetical protein H6765_11430 [Candidatus Peribacteria bacterium]